MAANYIVLNAKTDNEADENIDNTENVADPLLLSKNLNRLMKTLKGDNFMDDSSIDYVRLVNSDIYKKDYNQMSNQLKKVDLNLLLDANDDKKNDNNLLAFFINIYNALTIHSIAYLSSQKKASDGGNLLNQMEGKFWSKMAYMIGKENQTFSLDDIEHGILRGNRPHPSSINPQFGSNDQRKKFAVKSIDPRIHFTLNCGAKSCPPISFYTLDNLERGLDTAAKSFLTNETNVNVESKEIELSKLLLWYREDFVKKGNESMSFSKKAVHYAIITKNIPIKWMTSINKDDMTLIEFVYHNMKENDDKKQQLKNLMETKGSCKITYAPYDFNINFKN